MGEGLLELLAVGVRERMRRHVQRNVTDCLIARDIFLVWVKRLAGASPEKKLICPRVHARTESGICTRSRRPMFAMQVLIAELLTVGLLELLAVGVRERMRRHVQRNVTDCLIARDIFLVWVTRLADASPEKTLICPCVHALTESGICTRSRRLLHWYRRLRQPSCLPLPISTTVPIETLSSACSVEADKT